MRHMVVNRRKIIIVFPPFPCQIFPVKRPRDCRADARVWLPGECLVTANLNPSYRWRNSGVERYQTSTIILPSSAKSHKPPTD
jgi:hypothetical protein